MVFIDEPTTSLRKYEVALYKGRQKKGIYLLKNCAFILTCFNFGHLQSTLYLKQYTYRDFFSHCSKQFLNSSILMLFNVLLFFVSPLPHQQNISL